MTKGLEIGGAYKPHHPEYLQMDIQQRDHKHVINFTQSASEPWPTSLSDLDVVYTSHVLEHLDGDGPDKVLRSAYKALREGGIIKIATIDFGKVCRVYLDLAEEDLYYLIGSSDSVHTTLYGEVDKPNHKHLRHHTTFDRKRITKMLEDVGFKDIKFLEVNPIYKDDNFCNQFGKRVYEVRRHYELYVEGIR